MKITLVMCEGPHDSAFLSRLLKANGFKAYSEPIQTYPQPVKDFVVGQLKVCDEGVNICESRNGRLLPSYALKKKEGDDFLFLFNMGGDTQKEKREIIVKYMAKTANPMFSRGSEGFSLRLAYVYDADKKGVDVRISEVNDELKEFGIAIEPISQSGWSPLSKVEFGAYIFADSNRQGRLENLVLPAMKDTCPKAFGAAEQYLDRRDSYGLPSEMGKGYDIGKSLISIIGQLEKSGCANAAIIEQSHFIDNDKLMAYSTIKEIIRFLN